MALIFDATLHPTKAELLEDWLPRQDWATGDGRVQVVARFRFDDPEGEVGLETFLVRRGEGPVLHVPLSYRAAPLEGGEQALVGTMQHSVLGERWVYDAVADPVYRAVVLDVVRTAGTQVEEFDPEGKLLHRPQTAQVAGVPGPDGDVVDAEVEVLREVGGRESAGAGALTASWDGGGVVVLALVR